MTIFLVVLVVIITFAVCKRKDYTLPSSYFKIDDLLLKERLKNAQLRASLSAKEEEEAPTIRL